MPFKLSRRSFMAAFGSTLALAGEGWSDKAYTEWDDKQVQKMLHDSPWSKKVVVSLPGVGGGGNGGGGGGRRGGGGGGSADRLLGGRLLSACETAIQAQADPHSQFQRRR
jgi:hypothetical protein